MRRVAGISSQSGRRELAVTKQGGAMVVLWWGAWLVLAALRVVLLREHFGAAVGVSWAVGVVELLALIWGTANAIQAKERFCSLGGLWVAVAYAAGVAVLPSGRTSAAGALLALAGVVLSTWALFCLRSRFSIAASAWVGLCDWGPYRWVRHPQLLARVVIITGYLIGAEDAAAVVRCCVALALTASVIIAEEGELRHVAEWASYRRRVRFALLPGVV